MTVQIMIVEDDLELRDQYRTLIQGRNEGHFSLKML